MGGFHERDEQGDRRVDVVSVAELHRGVHVADRRTDRRRQRTDPDRWSADASVPPPTFRWNGIPRLRQSSTRNATSFGLPIVSLSIT